MSGVKTFTDSGDELERMRAVTRLRVGTASALDVAELVLDGKLRFPMDAVQCLLRAQVLLLEAALELAVRGCGDLNDDEVILALHRILDERVPVVRANVHRRRTL